MDQSEPAFSAAAGAQAGPVTRQKRGTALVPTTNHQARPATIAPQKGAGTQQRGRGWRGRRGGRGSWHARSRGGHGNRGSYGGRGNRGSQGSRGGRGNCGQGRGTASNYESSLHGTRDGGVQGTPGHLYSGTPSITELVQAVTVAKAPVALALYSEASTETDLNNNLGPQFRPVHYRGPPSGLFKGRRY